MTGSVPGNQQVTALALDSSGDVFAAGWTRNASTQVAFGWDFTVVKLAGSDGRELWRVVIDGEAGLDDRAELLTVDSAGDAIAAGYIADGREGSAFSVLKLSGATGDIVWRQDLPGFRLALISPQPPGGIALTNDGDVLVGVSDQRDIPTIEKVSVLRLSSLDGSEVWRSGIGSGGGQASALSMDPSSGDVVAGGKFCENPLCPLDEQGQQRNQYFGVVKLAAADGAVRWRRTLPIDESVLAVSVDRVGAVWALGSAVARLAGEDGAEIWRRSGDLQARALSIAQGGDAVVAGYEVHESQGERVFEAVLAKVSSENGEDIWRVSVGAGEFLALALDASGSAVAAGLLNTPEGSGFALAKLSDAGGLSWQRVLGPPQSYARAVAVDAAGHIVGAGRLYVIDGTSLLRVVKLSRDGADYHCVNGVTEPGDECDDGNLADGDGCDSNCTVSRCGNMVTAGFEECDDGNALDGDGCDSNCTVTACGNGLVTAGEECDDGNATNGDGCDTNCTTSRCGNGVAGPTEQCDDGNLADGDGCDSNCTQTGCGNGVLTAGESCDDGNLTDADGCDSNCTPTGCQNGVVTEGEECDDGNALDGDGCDSNCTPTRCGNAIRTEGEECDDGNPENGDGCDSNCTTTRCGNGVRTEGEGCDDGNLTDGDGCDSNCTRTGCGNGVVTAGEQCDDGNLANGDGCEADCRFPPTPTPTVTATPSQTRTPTRTRTVTATGTITSTPTVTRTVTATRTVTRTFTVTPTRTFTPTPRVVRISVASAIGAPGDTVAVPVALASAAFPVAATANEIEFPADALQLSPSDCEVNRAIEKTLVTTVLDQDEFSTRLRFFVQSTENTAPIPDGPLYTCRFQIRPGTLPGSYSLSNGAPLAFNPAGGAIQGVRTQDGAITVSLVPRACPGDCDGSRTVAVNELVTGVTIALGNAPLSRCLALDRNADGTVSVDELIRAVGALLTGCA